MVFLKEYDWLPPIHLETQVDAFRFGVHFRQQVAVSLDLGAAGSAYLDKSELLLVCGIFVQESLDAAKLFQNSLGVIDSINTHPHIRSVYTEALEQRRSLKVTRSMRSGRRGRLGEGDADRKRPHRGGMAGTVDGGAVPLDSAFERPIYRLQKVHAMRLRMEADQVSA